jgi:hypothetical protein
MDDNKCGDNKANPWRTLKTWYLLQKSNNPNHLVQPLIKDVKSAVSKLKSLFPSTPLEKHASLDIIMPGPSEDRQRTIIFRDLGRVENTWVATQFFLAYFEGKGISPPVGVMMDDLQLLSNNATTNSSNKMYRII